MYDDVPNYDHDSESMKEKRRKRKEKEIQREKEVPRSALMNYEPARVTAMGIKERKASEMTGAAGMSIRQDTHEHDARTIMASNQDLSEVDL